MTDTRTGVQCEATRWCDGRRCQHPAKYLVPYDSSAACGSHARAFLRCIPIADLEPETQP